MTFADTNADSLNKIHCVPAIPHPCKVNWQEARNKEQSKNVPITLWQTVVLSQRRTLTIYDNGNVNRHDTCLCKYWLHHKLQHQNFHNDTELKERTSRTDYSRVHRYKFSPRYHEDNQDITDATSVARLSDCRNGTCFYSCESSITSANKINTSNRKIVFFHSYVAVSTYSILCLLFSYVPFRTYFSMFFLLSCWLELNWIALWTYWRYIILVTHRTILYRLCLSL